jgi:hypothetical protein
MKLKDLKRGQAFTVTDAGFNNGAEAQDEMYVRETTGYVIGETSTNMVPVIVTRRRHFNPATDEAKFDYNNLNAYSYMHELTQVELTPPQPEKE